MTLEEDLLNKLKEKVTRKDIVSLYALMIYFEDLIDWKKVNRAIIKKWSLSGLIYIKRLAWKQLESSKEKK